MSFSTSPILPVTETLSGRVRRTRTCVQFSFSADLRCVAKFQSSQSVCRIIFFLILSWGGEWPCGCCFQSAESVGRIDDVSRSAIRHTHTHTHIYIYLYVVKCVQAYKQVLLALYRGPPVDWPPNDTHTHLPTNPMKYNIHISICIHLYTHTHIYINKHNTHMHTHIQTHTHIYI
jgi:hypothetical protein